MFDPEQDPRRVSRSCHHSSTSSPEQSKRADALTMEGEERVAFTTA